MSVSDENPADAARSGIVVTLLSMPFILAFRNLVHDKIRLTATIAGLTFAVILIGVQLGIYFGVRRIISDVIDHTHATLWIVPFHARSFEEAYGVLGEDERHQALAVPGVRSVVPIVVFFGTWNRPDRGITHVVVVGSDAEDGGLAPWNLRGGDWNDIKSLNGIAVDETYLSALGIAGIGSRASIDFGDSIRTVDVKALTEGIRSFTQAPYVFTTNARARQIFGIPEDKSTFFLVEVAPQANVSQVKKEISDRLSSNAEVLTQAEFRSRSIIRWLYGTRVGIALIFGTVLGVIVGMAIEAQTLYSATLDHINEFAVLRMLGSSSSYLHRIILTQAALISLAGFALGTACVLLVSRLSQHTALPMVIPPELIVATLIGSLVVGVVSAIAAVVRVLRIDPAAVLMR
jgi:putative ABC transport system permease protein